jgi:putative ABC transport system permease protein
MTTIRIALRNVFRHRTRSVITLSAIAFGCIALIFVGGFFEDLFFKMRESYIKGHTGHLQIYRRGFFERGSGQPFDYLIEDPQEILPFIRRLDGVASVTTRIEFAGLLSTGDNTVSCLIQGVQPRYEPTIRPSDVDQPKADLPSLGGSVIEAGDPLAEEEPYGVVLGKGLAASLAAKPGDGLVLVAHTIEGSVNALDVTLRGTFFTSAKAFDDRTLRLPLATAQELLRTEAVQSLVVMLDDTRKTRAVQARLEQLFALQRLDLELRRWDQLSDFYDKTQTLFGRMFWILKLVIAIVAVLSIFNTMNMAVIERTTEIGTIMALGTKPRGVLWLFLCEGLALGLIGGLIGVFAGSAVVLLVGRLGIPMPPPPGATMSWVSEPMWVASSVTYAFGLALATAVVSSLVPAYKASRLEIVEALRHA